MPGAENLSKSKSVKLRYTAKSGRGFVVKRDEGTESEKLRKGRDRVHVTIFFLIQR